MDRSHRSNSSRMVDTSQSMISFNLNSYRAEQEFRENCIFSNTEGMTTNELNISHISRPSSHIFSKKSSSGNR